MLMKLTVISVVPREETWIQTFFESKFQKIKKKLTGKGSSLLDELKKITCNLTHNEKHDCFKHWPIEETSQENLEFKLTKPPDNFSLQTSTRTKRGKIYDICTKLKVTNSVLKITEHNKTITLSTLGYWRDPEEIAKLN